MIKRGAVKRGTRVQRWQQTPSLLAAGRSEAGRGAHHRLLVSCVSAVIACAFLLAAQDTFAATHWTEHDFSAAAGEDIYSAQVFTSSDGTQNAAWRRHYEGGEEPVFERTRSNGEVIVGPTVLSNSERQTFSVSEATTPDDTTYVVWDETGIGVQADIVTPSGEIRSLPMLSSGATSAAEVSVSLNAEDNAVVVWGYPKLEYAVINPAGDVVKQQMIMQENGSQRNVVTTSVPSGVFVAWTESAGSKTVVKATRISEATNEPGSVFNLDTNPSDSAYSLHVAANATGDVIASWAAEEYEPYEANVRSAIVFAGTIMATQEVLVELPGVSYTESSAPYIYPNGAGGVAATSDPEAGPAELIVTPIAATGVAGNTYVVPTTGGAEGLSVATNAAGNAYLQWVEEVSGTPRAVTAELTEDTTPRNTETLLTPVSPNRTLATINASGELILAAWNRSDETLRSYVRPTLNACVAGTYSANGNEPCTAAQPGSYVAMGGATAQTPCSPGAYSSASGATSCTTTLAGTYATGGATRPTPCPAGTESGAGASQCTHTPTKPEATPVITNALEGPPVITNALLSRRCATRAALNADTSAGSSLHFSYTLNETAKVEYTVSRRVGSPVWTSCPARRGHSPGTYEASYTSNGFGLTGLNGVAVTASTHVTAYGRRGLKHSLTLAAVIADARGTAQNLRPGTYLISVIAVNAQGERSQRATLKFWVLKRHQRTKSQSHTPTR